jgi:3-oxoacyl-[acyl-carrier protein] reductase
MLEIHTVVPFRLCRAAAPYLREAGKADKEAGREVFRKVVNVTSISGTQGNVGQANYSAAKAGLVGLTKTLAREWGPFKVNVNAVAFGFVETRLTAATDDGAGESFVREDGFEIPLGIPGRMRELAPVIIPLGRPATPEDAAGPIFFLCSPWANFVHGQVITASGGQTTGMTS